ncbi:hypothetical protein E3N88_03511 [Mikania micrantha]|uniref:Uncharacterized protein n=1 Tax=Mikania micrantha TaxID=192012 RepID=A0A5N6Q6S4_9ASTR|nr:hypothetical protein E3N88_03511 [Mikania micrantha]
MHLRNEHRIVTPRNFQSRNGQERDQNSKTSLLGLTFGPGGTPDPEHPRQALRADEESGASSGCLRAKSFLSYSTHFPRVHQPSFDFFFPNSPATHLWKPLEAIVAPFEA